MIAVPLVALAIGLVCGIAIGRAGMVDPISPREDRFPLPLALRLADEQRKTKRWSRLGIARWLWRAVKR